MTNVLTEFRKRASRKKGRRLITETRRPPFCYEFTLKPSYALILLYSFTGIFELIHGIYDVADGDKAKYMNK